MPFLLGGFIQASFTRERILWNQYETGMDKGCIYTRHGRLHQTGSPIWNQISSLNESDRVLNCTDELYCFKPRTCKQITIQVNHARVDLIQMEPKLTDLL